METATDRRLLRIGELSRRVGISDHLDAFGDPAAQAVLDRVLAVPRDVMLPYLAGLGKRWQRRTASVAQEHFATNVIRGRHTGLARGCGHGPQALEPLRAEFADLAWRIPLALAGAGATAQIADAAGARLMAGDPVTEAGRAGWPR